LSDPAEVLGAARRELARLLPVLEALVGDLDEPTARARPEPGEWAPVEILCHLRDEETEDFGARLRAVLEGKRELAPIDPVRWVEERRYREARPADVLEALRSRRRASLDFLAALAPGALVARSIPHASLGRLSGLDLLVAWVEHDRLHVRQLAGALARLWASRWAPLKAEYAGPIPHARAGGN
jgi:hypothetical protein